MAVSRVIEVSFGRSSVALVRIDTAYFYNNGIIFKPTDIDLPASYQVHWADSPQASSTLETIGTAEGAPIPDDLWNRSRVIYGWIYLHPTEDSGVTGYEVRIYKNVRAGLPDGTEPTPEEQSVIDQAISALNTAVAKTAQDVISADQSARSAQGYAEQAETAKDTAQTYANNAQTSATQASTSASQASQSATASAQSASQSAQIKADVESLADDAQGYADSASQSASQASASEQGCARAVLDAASAAAIARARADEASGYAQTASAKAQNASQSASTASQKATEASQSASQALGYKNDAESAKTASQTAQGLAESARDSAITAKDAAESARDDAESARDEAQQAVASISGALDDKAPVITDTASGAIASFSDGADDLPLKSLVVNIDPVQDLHGYDSPWPAGGGKNLFNPDTVVVGYINDTTGGLTETSVGVSSRASEYIAVDGGTSYFFANSAPSGRWGAWYDENKGYISSCNGVGVKTAPSAAKYVRITVSHQNNNPDYADNVMVAKSTAEIPWSPYENICPISGWTEVNVNHSDADMTNPTTLTIQLGQTVYGGKLDVLSGELVIDRAMVDLGTLSWWKTLTDTANVHRYASGGITTSVKAPSANNVKAKIVCSSYETHTADEVYLKNIGIGIIRSGDISIYDPRFDKPENTAAEFKEAMNGVMLCYELAEPIEIQLTPHEVNSLYGVNNLWADSGDTEVEYRADTKLYINKKIAEAISALS